MLWWLTVATTIWSIAVAFRSLEIVRAVVLQNLHIVHPPRRHDPSVVLFCGFAYGGEMKMQHQNRNSKTLFSRVYGAMRVQVVAVFSLHNLQTQVIYYNSTNGRDVFPTV